MEGQTNDHILHLVSTALRQNKLSGLSEMLRSVAEAVNAYGCILWDVAPGASLEVKHPSGRLFVLAEWFRDNRVLVMHDMPLNHSINGAAILNKQSVNVLDVSKDARFYRHPAFLIDAKIKTMCAVPVGFSNDSEWRGALGLYRNELIPFTAEEVAKVEQMALLIPDLYLAIRDKVSQRLVSRVNNILQRSDESRMAGLPQSRESVKRVFQRVCNVVSATFQCIETSIFLEDPSEAVGKYKLMATTWPSRNFKKEVYRPTREEGLTGWVLEQNKPIKIFNLSDFQRDIVTIRREYPGLTWSDSLNIKETIGKFLNLSPGADLQPLSFMAAPLFRGHEVLGVIRCCAAREGPYYFAERGLNLLGLISGLLSRFWSNWLVRQEIEEENRSWQALVSGVGKLNSLVQAELPKTEPNSERIFLESLRVTEQVIRGADILDIRMYDEQTQELHFTTTLGKAWEEGKESEIQARKQRRFDVKDRSANRVVGVQVFQERETFLKNEKDNYHSRTFPASKRIIVAPIGVRNDIVGVLDVRGTGPRDFPQQATKMAELLGQQLGMYQYLSTAISDLHKAEDDRKRREQETLQTQQDLAHQLKTPVIQAYARIQAVIQSSSNVEDEKRTWQLRAIKGLCGKARRVTMNTQLFAELARQDSITLNPTRVQRLQQDLIVRMLIEAASDNQIVLEPTRDISFNVERQSFEILQSYSVLAENDLLEQAVGCLLDNAGKYSFSKTTVKISGGLTRKGHFYLMVENEGERIFPQEVSMCAERLWRSEAAKEVTGEGSGIGLWVVDRIMKAHGGELVITPTTSDNITQVRLIFSSSN